MTLFICSPSYKFWLVLCLVCFLNWLQKKEGTDDVPFDKRRKIGAGRMVGPTNSGRTRQAFAVVSNRQDAPVASNMGGAEGAECGNIEFTKEEVEALLNEKPKAKKFDLKVWLSNPFFC